MRFRVWGNYGGPGWSAGKYVEFGEDPDWSVEPVDWLDTIFRDHDMDYWKAEVEYRRTGDEATYRESIIVADDRLIESISIRVDFESIPSDRVDVIARDSITVFRFKQTIYNYPNLNRANGDVPSTWDGEGWPGFSPYGTVNEYWWEGRTPPRRDPLAIDLDGDGIETLGTSSAGGPILFDHDADGIRTGTGWLKGDDAWLVMDRNANGTIDSGRELFGVDTIVQRRLSDGSLVDCFAANGFQALASVDTNGSGGVADGRFDSQDAGFAQVRLWRDLNSDGVSQAVELSTLASAGITSIDLSYAEGTVDLGNGNRTTGSATVTRAGGADLAIVGVDLVAANLELTDNPFYREFSEAVPLSVDAVSLPNMRGSGWLRDLREAMSLGTPAASDLVARVRDFAATPTREGQLAGLDAVIDAWAHTTGRVNEVANMGHVGDWMKYALIGQTGLQ